MLRGPLVTFSYCKRDALRCARRECAGDQGQIAVVSRAACRLFPRQAPRLHTDQPPSAEFRHFVITSRAICRGNGKKSRKGFDELTKLFSYLFSLSFSLSLSNRINNLLQHRSRISSMTNI